jgi:uncharacterized membrane protein YbhN (UPF0104 family)
VVSIGAVTAAVFVLVRVLHGARWGDIVRYLADARPYSVAGAVALTVINNAVLTGYDFFGLRAARCTVPLRTVAFTSFLGDTMNANAGFSALTGSLVKCRIYTGRGCRLGDVVRAISYYTAAYWAGFCMLAAFFMLFQKDAAAGVHSGGNALIWARTAVIALIPALFMAVSLYGKPFSAGRFRVDFPPPGHAAALLLVSVADWLSSLTVMWLLVPAGASLSFGAFGAAFLCAHFLGNASQAPGGIIVFEASLLAGTGASDIEAVASALVLYRLIFFAFPFAAALVMFAVSRHGRFRRAPRACGRQEAEAAAPGSVADLPFISAVVAAYNE